ncbi:hypothetical protein KP509_12G027200 [Ceratopteris richardii]|uniref:Uncharacterized protein n=1 Tax=Ceratopteris richardii TaxID=49495 RepID=A0A8T2TK59_CERRI|nr:hypothetical protein KP509_12G027200 [Ceratopteris richardii]
MVLCKPQIQGAHTLHPSFFDSANMTWKVPLTHFKSGEGMTHDSSLNNSLVIVLPKEYVSLSCVQLFRSLIVCYFRIPLEKVIESTESNPYIKVEPSDHEVGRGHDTWWDSHHS